MPFWTMLLTYVVTFLISELLRPKPDIENAKPAGLGDFQVPTATEGRSVPIVFGRVNMKGPNVVWYGDYRTVEIKKKVKTGMFSSENITIGHKYYLGLQMALCRGPMDGSLDRLFSIRNDDNYVWGIGNPGNETPVLPSATGTFFHINRPELFGKAKEPNEGGMIANCNIYSGSQTQDTSNYLSSFQSQLTAYRGTVYIQFKRGYVGNSPQLRAFEFEVGRYPNGLGLSDAEKKVSEGANPMNVIYEILTNTEWGLSLPDTRIDTTNLVAIAATLAAEGQGYSWVWDSPSNVSSFINDIEQQVDGVLIQQPTTGLFDFRLIRDDYTPGTLPLLDESNVLDVEKFKRPSFNSTQNVVRIKYNDRRKAFKDSYALAQDSANIDIVQAVNTAEVVFPGVKDATLANSLAWRELRLLSYPIATGRAIVNRTQYELTPGDVRELSWARLGLTRLPIRITKINRGNLLKGKIAIDFTEDIFAANAGSFSDPSDTLFVPPDTDALAAAFELIFELPFRFTDVSFTNINTTSVQLATFVVPTGFQETGYNIYVTADDVPTIPPDPTSGDQLDPGLANGTTPFGLLTAPLDRGETNGFQDAIGFVVDNEVNLDELLSINAGELENLENCCLIDEELILFSDVLDNGDGTFDITNIVRGALDTIPDAHLDNAQVWFFTYGVGLVNAIPEGDPTFNYKVRMQLFTQFNTFNFALTNINSFTSDGRANRAYPPRDVEVNPAAPGGGYFPVDAGSPSGAELVGDLAVTWAGSDKFTQAQATAWDDPHVQQEAGSAFRIKITEDPGGTDLVVLDVSGIPTGATGGAYNASAFADDTVTDLYQVELSSISPGGESQVWLIGPFNIYGFGYKMDEKFGGDTDGILLAKGDPPVQVDPIPGVTSQSVFRFTFGGVYDSADGWTVKLSFLELGQATAQNENFTIFAGSYPSITDMVAGLQSTIAGLFDSIKVQTAIDPTGLILTVSTSFGTLGGSVFNTTAVTRIELLQEASGALNGQQHVVSFDLWEGDPTTSPSTEILASAASASYNNAANQGNKVELALDGVTLAAKRNLEKVAKPTTTINWGGRLVSPGTQAVARTLPLRDGTTTAPFDDFASDLLGQLKKLAAEEWNEYIAEVDWSNWNPAGGGQVQDRPAVQVRMRPNYLLKAPANYDTTDNNTYFTGLFGPLKLLMKEVLPATRSARFTGFKHVVNVNWQNVFDDGGAPFAQLVAGQVYTITINATTYTEIVTAGDVASTVRDGIYSRFKTQIDASGTQTCILNTGYLREDGQGSTYTISMDIESDTNSAFTFSATASNGITHVTENFDQ